MLLKFQNKIEKSEENRLVFKFDKAEAVLLLEEISGSWHSRSPAISYKNGNPYLLGVRSHSDSDDALIGKYGIDDVYMRLFYFKFLVDKILKGNEQLRRNISFKKPKLELSSDLFKACKLETF